MKVIRLITVIIISTALTACGSKETGSPVTDTGTTIQADETTAVEKEELSAVKNKDAAKPEETEESIKDIAEEAKTENIAGSQAGQKKEDVYEDNFAVEISEAKAFAEKIKTAVVAKDIEALADLTAFPVYVGIVGGGVKNRETFIELGAEKVFTPELIESVEGADISDLSPSMAGFSISANGKTNIIFGVVEGRLAISGINYE